MRSLMRSTSVTEPSSAMIPTSPVCRKPSRPMTVAVSAGRFHAVGIVQRADLGADAGQRQADAAFRQVALDRVAEADRRGLGQPIALHHPAAAARLEGMLD